MLVDCARLESVSVVAPLDIVVGPAPVNESVAPLDVVVVPAPDNESVAPLEVVVVPAPVNVSVAPVGVVVGAAPVNVSVILGVVVGAAPVKDPGALFDPAVDCGIVLVVRLAWVLLAEYAVIKLPLVVA